MSSTGYNLVRDNNGDYYIDGMGYHYSFNIGTPYVSAKQFKAYVVKSGKNVAYTGRIEFEVVNMTDTDIQFFLWWAFSGGEGVENVREVLFDPPINKNILPRTLTTKKYRKELLVLTCSYSLFFDLLNALGEDWTRFSHKNKVRKPKLVIHTDYFYKKRNLRGLVVNNVEGGLFLKKSNEGQSEEEYIFCKFEEDIGGSSLDGRSPKKDHLFLPKRVVSVLVEKKINQ